MVRGGTIVGDIFRLPICLAGAGFIWARGSLLFFMNKSVTDNAFSSLLDFTQMCSVVAVSIAVLIMGERLSDRRSLVVMATLGCIFSVIAAPLITNVLPVAQSEQTFRLWGRFWMAWRRVCYGSPGDCAGALRSWRHRSGVSQLDARLGAHDSCWLRFVGIGLSRRGLADLFSDAAPNYFDSCLLCNDKNIGAPRIRGGG